MIVVINNDAEKKDVESFKEKMIDLGFKLHESQGENSYLIGLIGDTSTLDPEKIRANRIIKKLVIVQEPYKKANKIFNHGDAVIEMGNKKIGDGHFAVIAGPCSVESQEQVVEIARSIKESGASCLRGGAFKPRTSPYSFQGLGREGLEFLINAKKETGLPIVTELMSPLQVEKYADLVDVIQIGARNMQNYDLLREAGKTKKPVLIKRGMSATIEELLMSAEYVLSEGNSNVILCERGIRSFQRETRNVLDLSSVPLLKSKTHLPVVVDPSHATGIWSLVEPMSKAAVAAGADGIMVEVHNDPANALSDGQQSIKPDRFNELMKNLLPYLDIENKKLS